MECGPARARVRPRKPAGTGRRIAAAEGEFLAAAVAAVSRVVAVAVPLAGAAVPLVGVPRVGAGVRPMGVEAAASGVVGAVVRLVGVVVPLVAVAAELQVGAAAGASAAVREQAPAESATGRAAQSGDFWTADRTCLRRERRAGRAACGPAGIPRARSWAPQSIRTANAGHRPVSVQVSVTGLPDELDWTGPRPCTAGFRLLLVLRKLCGAPPGCCCTAFAMS
jgi:hypothetical protein